MVDLSPKFLNTGTTDETFQQSRIQDSFRHIEEFFRNITGILVLEGKTSKEIPESSRLGFLEKFLANNFALSDAEDNTCTSLNRGGVANIPLYSISNLPKVPRTKFLGSDDFQMI